MLKLRHLCLKEIEKCPDVLRDDLGWEVINEGYKVRRKIKRLNDSIDFLKNQRYKTYEFVSGKIKKRIYDIGEEISQFLFDDWNPDDHTEEVWREYFFCLYEFMISEHTFIDITSNIDTCIKVYEGLKKPNVRQSQMVHLMDYKFVELYSLYKSLKFPKDPVEEANAFLEKKMKITEQIRSKRAQLRNAMYCLDTYTELLSSSLCLRK